MGTSGDTDEDVEFPVKYRGAEYHLDDFISKHPGGVNYLKAYKDKSIDDKLADTHHSTAAKYLLREYRAGGRDSRNAEGQEDLESLVDWDRAILPQVMALGPRYMEWVSAPVDRQARLFESDILETLTITPWYVVPAFWTPVILYFLQLGIHNYSPYVTAPQVVSIALTVLLGIVAWTLLEYTMHRWFFHMEPSGKYQLLIYVHFAIHGVHHKVPFDGRRLVFPPVPAAAIATVIYQLLAIVTTQTALYLLMTGLLIGYVQYDMIHFYLHHGAPKENSLFYNLKRYHNLHHFSHSDIGFGICTMFWDKVFGTTIKLRKLAMGIRW